MWDSKRKRPFFVVDKDGIVTLSGEVASIRLIASWPVDEKYDARAREDFQRIREELEVFAHESVKEQLGKEFRLEVEVTKGSIEVLLIISTAVNVMILYKDVIESINLIVSQVKRFLKYFLERSVGPYIVVSGGLSPNSPIVNVRRLGNKGIKSSDILLYYLIVSNAALLALFFWIIIRQLSLI